MPGGFRLLTSREATYVATMILGGHAIQRALTSGPWTAFRDGAFATDLVVGPNSVDVTLSRKFMRVTANAYAVDPTDASSISAVAFETTDYILNPDEFLLGAVRERFVASAPLFIQGSNRYFAPMYDGRSTMARIGLASHITAGFGDYGFEGAFTLELKNLGNSPIMLRHGMRIGQVFFTEVAEPLMYSGAYSTNHNDGPVAPVLGHHRV